MKNYAHIPAVAFFLATGIASGNPLTADGEKHLERYTAMLDQIRADVSRALPVVDPSLQQALDEAHQAVKQAEADVDVAQKALGTINTARALVGHAKGKWIGDAEKGIAKAQVDLKNASTEAAREAASAELAKWEENLQAGLEALKERETAYEAAKVNEEAFKQAQDAAQAALAVARETEKATSERLIASLSSVLTNDRADATLAKGAILAHATPRRLAEFAQTGTGNAALIDQLLANRELMQEMLTAGGAAHGEWGNALAIYAAIRKASPRSAEGHFHRLAIGTSLAHARPIRQSRPADQSDQPQIDVDPVKRYLHYEKAFLDGELDPAFPHLKSWEYRHVVNCDSPDEILQWGRAMLRNYRPDHIHNADYRWRYVSSVRSEVPYGSQNVKYDDPSLHQFQNIIRNGGVCGRRAFFGRFVLRAFGIPTWGVTQRAHAAVGHWTPEGWVVVLGAGFNASWWDKDDVPMSGNHFLLDTQARAHAAGYASVLRSQWISRILDETAYNDRRNVAGGFWSRSALYQQRILAATATTLGPVGQELAEANDREQRLRSANVSADDRKSTSQNGTLIIPAVAHRASSGKVAAMRGFDDGMQLHCLGGFKGEYEISVPRAGAYQLAARVATVQTGQQFRISAGEGSAHEIDVPYTLGMWEHTRPVQLDLKQGTNTIHLELKDGSRGVTVKELLLRLAP